MEQVGLNKGMRVVYLSHGGGPMPLLGDPSHDELVGTLKDIAQAIEKPAAIIVVSAHWEASQATITSATEPELIYDYYGFPPESYQIQYPAKGSPELALALEKTFHDHGVAVALDEHRGFDHGVFVPLKIMFPDADIPCIQVSLVKGLDPDEHIKIGEAIAELNIPNLLVIGSGFSFHNMREFFAPNTHDTIAKNQAFESWLIETCSDDSLTYAAGKQRLMDWSHAPGARFCHPREEHLLPLHTCYGVAQGPANKVYELHVLGKKASAYLW